MQLDLESEGCDRRGLSSTCVPGGPTSFRVPFWRSRHIYCGCRVCRWSPEWSLQTLPVANIDKPRRDKHTTRSHSEPAYSTPHRELSLVDPRCSQWNADIGSVLPTIPATDRCNISARCRQSRCSVKSNNAGDTHSRNLYQKVAPNTAAFYLVQVSDISFLYKFLARVSSP